MRPTAVLLASALAALVLGAVGCSSSAAPPPPTDPVLARGQQVYAQSCAACHGSAGEGVTGTKLVGIAARQPDVATQIATIGNGVKGSTMVAWKDKLPPADIEAVARYIRTL